MTEFSDQFYQTADGAVVWMSAADHAAAAEQGLALPRADWTAIDAEMAAAIATWTPSEEDLWAALRAARDARLTNSDTIVVADRWEAMDAATRAAWTEYRQMLRDLPATTTDPTEPDWPVAPA